MAHHIQLTVNGRRALLPVAGLALFEVDGRVEVHVGDEIWNVDETFDAAAARLAEPSWEEQCGHLLRVVDQVIETASYLIEHPKLTTLERTRHLEAARVVLLEAKKRGE